MRRTLRNYLWVLPFGWILLLPLITVPLSLLLYDVMLECTTKVSTFFGTQLCQTSSIIPAYLPGTALLGAFAFWPLGPRLRRASLIAGALGSLRFVVPLVVILSYGPTFETTIWPPPIVVWAAASSALLYWLVTVPMFVQFARRELRAQPRG